MCTYKIECLSLDIVVQEMVQQINKKDDSQQLSITGVLALSNLVRDACVNSMARQQHFSSIVTPVCDRKLASQVTSGQWCSQDCMNNNYTI